MLTITGGKLRGRRVPSPPGSQTRPTTSRVRESLFQRLNGSLQEARFLDAFAGTGMMSLEALSRGAAFVCAMEKHRITANRLENQLKKFALPVDQWQVICTDTEQQAQKICPVAPFHILFLDPPYGKVAFLPLIENFQRFGWLEAEALIIVEQGSQELDLPAFGYRTYGDTKIGVSGL